MKALTAGLMLFFSAHILLHAQVIKVQPYLQDASPHSIFILWETDTSDESIVEWGLSDTLGNTTLGSAQASVGNARIHTVNLDSLESFTRYYYRVKTGTAESDIYNFKTPPKASDEESFRLVAMSDMQRDGAFPNKFQEVVENGIIDYLESEFDGNLVDQLALVLIPGDLVQNGNNYGSWEETFFNPAEDLFSHVPVYPVPGNHENNAVYFFQYFKLPDNGSPGFEEHWWYKDYGNVRIIGLDSNNPFSNQEQLDWLDGLLDTSCASDSIDFVFAQLHHPHKSELWTPGESNYTGEVINLLEQFSTDCGKPSLHFFGHTHAYSRGHSRDHKHLWINVATAGGAIDNWGEFPNFDYDEFAVSQDEYGFVSVEITDGPEPKMVIRRISRGDQDAIKDNELTDSLTVYLNPATVPSPTPLFPVNEEVIPECVILRASSFTAPNAAAFHGQSHWQVSTMENDFSNPVAESWRNFENWYFEENTQAGDDLSDEKIMSLAENEAYWWRVRYRDQWLNWSDWTAAVPFTTGSSIALPNLLLNPGAEDSLANWVVIEGVVEALTDGICDGVTPHSGERYLAVGGLCEHSPLGRCIQNVDVSAYIDSINAGSFSVNFGGYLSNYSGSDKPEMRIIFLDQDSLELGASNSLSTLNPSWTAFSESMIIPEQTRTIQMELQGTRNAGTDNDSYFDDLFLTVGSTDLSCSQLTNLTYSPQPISKLQVVPNPVASGASIKLPPGDYRAIRMALINMNGAKIACRFTYQNGVINLETSKLPKGMYFFLVREKGQIIGTGKVMLQ